MTETIVVKIKKAQGAAGFQHGIEVSDDFKALDPIVFENEADPDQVKGAHGFKRIAEVMVLKRCAGLIPIVPLCVLDSFFRIVNPQDLPAGLDHLGEDGGDLSRSAPRVQNIHSGLHTAPNRLMPHGLGIGFELKPEGFFGIFHQIGRLLVWHGTTLFGMQCSREKSSFLYHESQKIGKIIDHAAS
jgi:hypothetical protein